MNLVIVKDASLVGKETAKLFINQIKQKKNSILGLATGSSPIPTYQELIKENHEKKVSFKDVMTFNLDEYIGLTAENSHSYRYFMNENLFNHIDIDLKNTFIPSNKKEDLLHPEHYDEMIQKAGGIDLQLLGLGVNGHVGFNEPGTSFDSLTSVVKLAQATVDANARFFARKEDVPTSAVSMGLASIMKARKIVLIATGKNKADAIYHLINDQPNENWPVTILKNHPDVTIIIDEEAASLIK